MKAFTRLPFHVISALEPLLNLLVSCWRGFPF